MSDDGGPAFPVATPLGYASITGMTLRDWFAGQALIGMHKLSPEDAAKEAYSYADAMLASRKEPKA
jgi:hypothetical protein